MTAPFSPADETAATRRGLRAAATPSEIEASVLQSIDEHRVWSATTRFTSDKGVSAFDAGMSWPTAQRIAQQTGGSTHRTGGSAAVTSEEPAMHRPDDLDVQLQSLPCALWGFPQAAPVHAPRPEAVPSVGAQRVGAWRHRAGLALIAGGAALGLALPIAVIAGAIAAI